MRCCLLAISMIMIAVVGCESGGGDLPDADIPRLGPTAGFVAPSVDNSSDPQRSVIAKTETPSPQTSPTERTVNRLQVESPSPSTDVPPVDDTSVPTQPVEDTSTAARPIADLPAQSVEDNSTSAQPVKASPDGVSLSTIFDPISAVEANDSMPEVGTAADAAQVQADVRHLLDAFFSGDSDTLFEYTHSKIITKIGGPTNARKVLKESLDKALASGLKVEHFEFPEPPKFLKTDLHYFAIIPTRSIFKLGDKRMETINFQFGIRPIGREKWTYIEGTRINHNNVRSFFPDFPVGYRFPSIVRRDPDAAEVQVAASENQPSNEEPADEAEDNTTVAEDRAAEQGNDPMDVLQHSTVAAVHNEPAETTDNAKPAVEPTVYRQDLSIGLTLEARQVQKDVRMLLEAFFNADAETMLAYTHVKIIERMGGRAAAKVKLEKAIAGLVEKQGLKLEAFGFPKPPEFLQSDTHRFAIVPTRGIFATSNQRIESTNYQFGVRRIGQPGWMYIEGSRIGSKNVKEFFPDFPEGYKFPPIVQKELAKPTPPAEKQSAEGDVQPTGDSN